MKIAIVNNTPLELEILRRIVLSVPNYQVAWVARDGQQAVTHCAKDTPDLLLIDLHIPGLDGVETVRRIMQTSPCAIVIVTSAVKDNTSQVFQAMGYGALDAVNTPEIGTRGNPENARELLAKIATVSKLIGKSAKNGKSQRSSRISSSLRSSLPKAIVIGSSTGGPMALAKILSALPKTFRSAIVIVQHVDVQFSKGMADWLNEQTALPVKLALEGNTLEAGKVSIAGTNDHLILQSNLKFAYTKEPSDYPYRPSVDVFFKSVAQNWPNRGTAVLLTGMGRDGAEGLNLLRSKGWHTIAQDRQTSVVYGMPKAAAELGAAIEVLPIDRVAEKLMKRG